MTHQRFRGRYGLTAAVLAGLLALAACGSDNEDEAGDTPSGSGSGDCASGTLAAAGSSAQKPAFNAWIEGYQDKCADAAVNYDGQGSGFGITQFTQGQVSLAGSDSALKEGEEQAGADARCEGGKAVNIPMVATPVSFIYNIGGVDSLTVTPEVLAKIFSGAVTKWNDPVIAAANPDAQLPATTITPVHRSSDSGTTDNFTKFLDAQVPDAWTFGTGKAWKAPGGVGGKDSSAVVQQVKTTDGAVGYVDGPDARKNDLTPAALDTGNGAVEISADSVGKALSAAETTVDGADVRVDINYGLTDAGTYPAILVTYEITCTKGLPKEQAELVTSLLTYTASSDGQGLLTDLGHLPLPQDLLTKAQDAVSQIGSVE